MRLLEHSASACKARQARREIELQHDVAGRLLSITFIVFHEHVVEVGALELLRRGARNGRE